MNIQIFLEGFFLQKIKRGASKNYKAIQSSAVNQTDPQVIKRTSEWAKPRVIIGYPRQNAIN
ncbi:hypothetical protein [Pedobacter polysacchareus]|uniref:hypothetical protein n=1 Tax=Pedobacter polysacchareus TaxID=2861973 RepID=UPI001C9A015D|nr:hypothetical protein [Pedobacter polysacchareus]